ncbi:unnamed protein product, partial [Musa acuminata subsp. burmannicoides]
KTRPLPTSQQTPGHPCPAATLFLPSGDCGVSSAMSSSPSANSGSNGGVFLRGVLGCGVFLGERWLLRLLLHRQNGVSAPPVSLSFSSSSSFAFAAPPSPISPPSPSLFHLVA